MDDYTFNKLMALNNKWTEEAESIFNNKIRTETDKLTEFESIRCGVLLDCASDLVKTVRELNESQF